MSPDSNPPDVPWAEAEQLLHDLRNSLYAMRMGLQALSDCRQDEARFEAIVAMMEAEQRRAASRLDEFANSHDRIGK